MHFNGRLRKAARLAWNVDYCTNINAMHRCALKLKEMNVTPEEKIKVDSIVKWMEDQTATKDRWW